MVQTEQQIVCDCGEWLDIKSKPGQPISRGEGITSEDFADCQECGAHYGQAEIEHRLETAGMHREDPAPVQCSRAIP
jgi:hypothetical protein